MRALPLEARSFPKGGLRVFFSCNDELALDDLTLLDFRDLADVDA